MKVALSKMLMLAMTASALVACNSGGGGGGGGGGEPQPESPQAQWERRQKEQAQYSDRTVWQRQNRPPQFGQPDIANGRVSNRQFALVYGFVLEDGVDSCYPTNGGKYRKVSPISPANAEILLTFDSAGTLNMKISNFAGEHRSVVPLRYYLEPGAPIITVDGPIQPTPAQQVPGVMLRGYPSAEYVQMQSQAGYYKAKRDFFGLGRQWKYRGNLEKDWQAADLGLGFGPSGSPVSGGWGFDPNSPIETAGPTQPPPVQPGAWPQTFLPGVQTAGEISMLFDQNLKIRVETAMPHSPRHIMKMIMWDIPYVYTKQVKTEKTTCVDTGKGRIKAYLQ